MNHSTVPPHLPGLQEALIEKLKRNGVLTETAVEAAFRAVPRHLFLPGVDLERVYSDDAIPTKFEDGKTISSSSQPAIMAIMLEQLDLHPGQRVLEVGAGTGYNAALMGYLVGKNGRITTLDIDQDIVEAAQTHLNAAGCHNVTAVCGDGMEGYAAHAPYDRIILTVGGWEIAPAWVEQLAENGRIVLPLSLNGPQFSVAFARESKRLVSQSISACGFMPLRGPHSKPGLTIPFDVPGLTLNLNTELAPADATTMYHWLTGPHQDWPTALETTMPEVWRSLFLWLALHEPHLGHLTAQGTAVEQQLVPPLMVHRGEIGWCMTIGVVSDTGMAWLMCGSEEPPPDREVPFPLVVRQFGADEDLPRRLVQHVKKWEENGRLSDNFYLQVYPKEFAYAASPGEVILTKQWHQFVLGWEM